MLGVNYPIATSGKEVYVHPFYLLSNLRDFLALLSPASLIYHQWISRSPLMASPLILLYKMSGKTAHFLEHILNLLRFCFPAIVISLAQTHKNYLQVWTCLKSTQMFDNICLLKKPSKSVIFGKGKGKEVHLFASLLRFSILLQSTFYIIT